MWYHIAANTPEEVVCHIPKSLNIVILMHRRVGLRSVLLRLPPQICFRRVGGLVSPILKRFFLILMSLLFLMLRGWLSSVSRKVAPSEGALRDVLSSDRPRDVQGSSGLLGPSVSLAVTSPSVPRIVLMFDLLILLLPLPYLLPLALLFSVPPPAPLSDIPL